MTIKVDNKGTKSTTDIYQYNCSIYGKLDKEISTKILYNLCDKKIYASKMLERTNLQISTYSIMGEKNLAVSKNLIL